MALALIAFILNWKYNRYLTPVYLPLTILLFVSTVYLYAHYFIDIPAGIAAGIVLYLLVPLCIKPAQRVSKRVDEFLAEKLQFSGDRPSGGYRATNLVSSFCSFGSIWIVVSSPIFSRIRVSRVWAILWASRSLRSWGREM